MGCVRRRDSSDDHANEEDEPENQEHQLREKHGPHVREELVFGIDDRERPAGVPDGSVGEPGAFAEIAIRESDKAGLSPHHARHDLLDFGRPVTNLHVECGFGLLHQRRVRMRDDVAFFGKDDAVSGLADGDAAYLPR